jgi:hypothetical protein
MAFPWRTGIAIRRGLALLLMALLAGCQGDKPPPQKPSYEATTGMRDSLARDFAVKAAMLDYMLALSRTCRLGDPAGSEGVVLGTSLSARDECLTQQIRNSLGVIGVPEAACDQQVVASELLSCSLFGSAAMRLMTAAGSDPDEMMNWSDPGASLNLAANLLATRSALACGRSAQISCVTREMGTSMLLPASVVDTCAGQASGRQQIRCVATEFLLDHIRSAILYAG